MRVTVRDQSRKVNHLSKVICYRKIASSAGISVPPEYISQFLGWTLKSPKANTLADDLI